jgi:hypothetical protein
VIVCVQKNAEEDNGSDLARGFGFQTIAESNKLLENGFVKFSIKYVNQGGSSLIINRQDLVSTSLEARAEMLDWLWERVSKFVRLMMELHSSFEVVFYKKGEEIFFSKLLPG